MLTVEHGQSPSLLEGSKFFGVRFGWFRLHVQVGHILTSVQSSVSLNFSHLNFHDAISDPKITVCIFLETLESLNKDSYIDMIIPNYSKKI